MFLIENHLITLTKRHNHKLEPMKKSFIPFLAIIFFVACQPNQHRQELQNAINQWKEKKIIIPQLSSIKWNEYDSCNLYSLYDYKIVYYIDGDCHDCVINLPRIDSVYQTIRTQNSVILVYVHSFDYTPLENEFNRSKSPLQIPLIYDKENQFYTENKLPLDPLFHCFLVDKDNRVVVAGSFLANQQMTELYERVLKSKR